MVSAAPAAAKASCLSASAVTTIGRTGQRRTARATAWATTGEATSTGTSSGSRRASSDSVRPNTGSSRGTSLRRLPGISTSTGAVGDRPCRARKRAPSPVSAPDCSTGWPTYRASSPCRAKKAGSNGSRQSSRSQRPGYSRTRCSRQAQTCGAT